MFSVRGYLFFGVFLLFYTGGLAHPAGNKAKFLSFALYDRNFSGQGNRGIDVHRGISCALPGTDLPKMDLL